MTGADDDGVGIGNMLQKNVSDLLLHDAGVALEARIVSGQGLCPTSWTTALVAGTE